MITAAWYLLKVSICLLVLYIPYLMLFRNKTFFNANRLYLLLTLIFSFVIPTLEISQPAAVYSIVGDSSSEVSLTQYYDDFHPIESIDTGLNYPLTLSLLYMVGVLVLTVRLIFSVRAILKLKRNSVVEKFDGVTILRVDASEPFSFFNFIFLPKTEINPVIIQHERIHIKQFHWIDVVLLEIAAIMLWFNPTIILFKRSLKLQHEYLADEQTIQGDVQPEDYLACMAKEIQRTHFYGPISNFYFQFIKNRISMITKKRTPIPFSGLYIILIPVICILSFAFSKKPLTTSSNPEDNTDVVENGIPSIAPVDLDKTEITSVYGMRMHPILGVARLHTGIDFQSPEGEIVKSTADGIVIENMVDSNRGQFILIKHRDIFSTSYSHLQRAIVKVGDKVQQGQIIGYVGNTGLSKGVHLHYEVLKNGEAVDPKDYLPKLD
jgi:beta-lactamase regulating signal transducer with metallopeptidase domain